MKRLALKEMTTGTDMFEAALVAMNDIRLKRERNVWYANSWSPSMVARVSQHSCTGWKMFEKMQGPVL